MLNENIVFLDLNPAAQGASLTEGKRAKRTSKKVNGENGDAPDDENDLSAHDRSGEHVSFGKHLNMLCLVYFHRAFLKQMALSGSLLNQDLCNLHTSGAQNWLLDFILSFLQQMFKCRA